jgi:hypothetical protein
LSYFWGDDKS